MNATKTIQTPPTMNAFETFNIISHHQSLASAVAAANPDFSYNPQAAQQKIRDIDQNCTRAIVVEGGDIYFVFSCDIQVLNKFEPFHSCMDSDPFKVAFINGNILSISKPMVPKNKEGRNWFKKAFKTSSAFAA